MAATTLTCPECGKVLKPAKPLAAGKRVKCPKCETAFAVPDEADDVPSKAVAAAKSETKKSDKAESNAKAGAAKGIQKADAVKPGKKPKPKVDEDDDEGGPLTYGYVDDHSSADEPEIDYAPNTKIKDLRGPAQEAVTGPSNGLIAYSVASMLSYMIFAFIMLIPIFFPVPPEVNTDGTPSLKPSTRNKVVETGYWIAGTAISAQHRLTEVKEKDEDPGSMFKIYTWDVMDVATYELWLVVLMVMPCVLGMLYCFVAAYGAYQMQTLQSRVWGMVSAIMVMTPACVFGLFCMLAMLITFLSVLLSALFGDFVVAWGFVLSILISFGGNLYVGVWSLKTLFRKEVVEGFEFVPE